MRVFPVLAGVIGTLLTLAADAEVPPATPQEAALRSHVAYLASDELQGRNVGTPGYDAAAAYVADQFRRAGLEGGAEDGGFLQTVPLVSYSASGPGRVTLASSAGSAALTPATDYALVANPAAPATRVEAPVVFVGYGIAGPDGIDDYAAVDVRGKIVAFLPGVPAGFASDEAAFLAAAANKAAFAMARGAAGAVQLTLPGGTAPRQRRETFTWANPDGTGFSATARAPLLATLSASGTEKLLAAQPGVQASTAAALAAGRRPAPVALPITLTVESATTFTPVRSANVVGVLPGRDPRLAREIVVLSAHLDHIGVSAKPDANGDAINNGAMDDAIGIASLIGEAKRFAAGKRPKRTIVFLAVTAEEKGLIGSDYFVRHPPRRWGEIVADVNLDMPILTYPFEDLVAFGGDRSTLGPIIARAAAGVGVTMSPDPVPQMGIFVRSDHFRFVQQGVPSVFLWPGHKGAGAAAYADFFARRYHRPADDLTQPIRWDQGVRFVDANWRIARDIANARTRPMWNKGEYFGRLYGGPMAP